MKKIFLTILILTSSVVQAQTDFFRNDTNIDINRNDQAKGFAKVDSKGEVSVEGLSTVGATSIAKAEDSAFANGDTFASVGGVINTNGVDLSTTEQDYVPMAVNNKGAPYVDIKRVLQTSDSGSLLKAEDAAHASGDAGVASLAVNNRNVTTFNVTQGDYTPIGVGDYGNVFVTPFYDGITSEDGTAISRTDSAGSNLSAILKVGTRRRDAIALQTGTDGDHQIMVADSGGRLITTPAPAGETWQGCGTATASTADVAIKAAVASNRIYVTSITCASSSATVATNINFKDGTTVIAVGGTNQMATTSAGTFTATFPVPLRGTSNTAFNFNTAVSVSSVVCCAAGYISVI